MKRILKLRTYPRVDLAKVSNWLVALSSYGLPLIELSSRKIAEREKKGDFSTEVKQQLTSWKESRELKDPDDLEYKYFLEGIGAILARQLAKEDLDVPLAQNLSFGDVAGSQPSRIRLYYLSRLGSTLVGYWNSKQYHLYESTLFWLLIRSEHFNPLIQGLISDPRFYQMGLQDELISSRDGVSRALVRKWIQYFSLVRGNRPDKSRLATILLFALALEINELVEHKGPLKEYVSELCRTASRRFSITETAVDFSVFLDCLYSHLDRQTIAGFPSGRGHTGLPSKPSIQILEVNSYIPLSIIGAIQPYEVQKAIVFGGFP